MPLVNTYTFDSYKKSTATSSSVQGASSILRRKIITGKTRKSGRAVCPRFPKRLYETVLRSRRSKMIRQVQTGNVPCIQIDD